MESSHIILCRLYYAGRNLLCGVDPRAYLADISKIVNGHLSSIDDLLPWAYPKAEPLKYVA